MKKNIAIIGAGFTGLASAYYLSKNGHQVHVFEKDAVPGGLAVGYQEKKWDWSLEKHYHHWFTNDHSVLDLARELNHNVIIERPKTSSLVGDDIFQLDSPLTLLKFPKLSLIDRIRTGASLAALRYNPFWKLLEPYHAETYLKSTMGKTAYQTIWQPLMENKLGEFSDDVSLAWFWARIKKRTSSLAYPQGGYLHFANTLVRAIEKNKGILSFSTEIESLTSHTDETRITYREHEKKKTVKFDAVIVTLPSFLFSKIAPDLPDGYRKKLGKLKGIGAVNMVLRLNKQFLTDNTYWLNMCNLNSPLLAIVEHTNFMKPSHYNNEHIVYLGNYVSVTSELYKKSDKELFSLYHDTLLKINPHYKKTLIDYTVFRAPFAQPIIPINYSKIMLPFKTPLSNVFLANIEQVYPWDRGTNYAVELGNNIAKYIDSHS